MLSGNLYGSEIQHGIFWGVKFWSRDFLGVLFEVQGIFWVLILPPFNLPVPWAMCKIAVLTTIVCVTVFHVLVAVALSDFEVPKNNSYSSCTYLMILLFESGV